VSLWGSQEPPTRSDIPVKTTSFACYDGYTQPNNVKETLALLEQEISTIQDIKFYMILTYLNQDMLAENEMDIHQNIRER
jgi:hypothetical protein